VSEEHRVGRPRQYIISAVCYYQEVLSYTAPNVGPLIAVYVFCPDLQAVVVAISHYGTRPSDALTSSHVKQFVSLNRACGRKMPKSGFLPIRKRHPFQRYPLSLESEILPDEINCKLVVNSIKIAVPIPAKILKTYDDL
jgi:hypothetical protein